jgi:hypothetical protein
MLSTVRIGAVLALLSTTGCSPSSGEAGAEADYSVVMASGGGDVALAFDNLGSPRLVVGTGADGETPAVGALRYAWQGKSGWVVEDLPVSGALPAIAIDSHGTPHITYYSGGSVMSYLTRGTDGAWHSYALDGGGGSVTTYQRGEVNHHLRVDSKNRLHLLYYNDMNPGRLVYGFMDAAGWTFKDIASGVTSRNNWLDLSPSDEPFAGWWDTDHFSWARGTEGWVPHELGIDNDAITDQGRYCAMVVQGQDTVFAKFWAVYRWKDSYGSQYADDLFGQVVSPDGGAILLNNAELEPGEPLYSPGPTLMYKNAQGGAPSVTYRDGGLWGAFGGRIPTNLGHWARTYAWGIDYPTGKEAAVWLQEDGVLYYNGPAVPTDGSGGGPLPDSDTWAGPDAAAQDASAPSCDPPDASGEPSWQLVGDPGVSAGETYVYSLAADAEAVWAAYRDSVAGNRLTVRRYRNCQWEAVGPMGLSEGEVNIRPSLSLYEGQAWVAFADAGKWDTVIVKQFSSAGWLPVGGPDSVGKPANDLALEVFNGIPYVVMARSDSFYRPSVFRHETVEWGPVGEEFLSDVGTQAVSIFRHGGGIAMAFSDGNAGSAATARRYDAEKKTWQPLGPDGFTPGQARPLTVAAGGGTVWAAYCDATVGDKLSVMRLDGDTWQQAGEAGFTLEPVASISIDVDPAGTPYLAYETVPGTAAVVTFDGTKWVPVGDASASLLLADAPVVHVSADSVPYLAFCDHAAGARLSVIAYR